MASWNTLRMYYEKTTIQIFAVIIETVASMIHFNVYVFVNSRCDMIV